MHRTRLLCLQRCSKRLFSTPRDPPLQRVALPTITSTSAHIAYTEEGNADSNVLIVALHGGPGSHRDFRYLSGALADSSISHRLLRFDLPGYGGSDYKVVPSGRNFASAIWQALDVLKAVNPATKVIALGHSLGGHVALEFAAQRTQSITAVALLSSVGLTPHHAIGNETLYPLHRWIGQHAPVSPYSVILQPLLQFGYVRIGGFPRSCSLNEIILTQQRVAELDFASVRRIASSLTCPVFHAYATDDHMIQAERSKELAAALPPGPRIVFDKGGHNIQKTKCNELAHALMPWIESLLSEAKKQ